mgnify:CR=1 FL=1
MNFRFLDENFDFWPKFRASNKFDFYFNILKTFPVGSLPVADWNWLYRRALWAKHKWDLFTKEIRLKRCFGIINVKICKKLFLLNFFRFIFILRKYLKYTYMFNQVSPFCTKNIFGIKIVILNEHLIMYFKFIVALFCIFNFSKIFLFFRNAEFFVENLAT